MSEFKFACPVCGQHVRCESDKTGTPMECPTCFQTIIVPQAPASESPKFVLTASQAQSRPVPQPVTGTAPKDDALPAGKFAITVLVVLLLAGLAGAGLLFWQGRTSEGSSDQPATNLIALPAPPPPVVRTVVPRPDDDTNWMLNLEGVSIPDTPASGWINGRSFLCDRATVQGGTLTLRQGTNGPLEVGLTIMLYARQGNDLAGQSINIATDRAVAPRIILRWMDELGENQILNFSGGYALRLVFGQVTSNQLPARIYLCTPDDLKSYVAGTFQAEIRKVRPPPKPKVPKPPRRPN